MTLFFLLTLTIIFLLLLLYFYRPPPDYSYPLYSTDLISPADGIVKSIRDVEIMDSGIETKKSFRLKERSPYQSKSFERKYKVIHIFIGIQDVHTQIYPSNGLIIKAEYFPTKIFKDARGNTDSNEHLDTYLDNGIIIRQIAGKIARRIEAYNPVGTSVKQGQQLGRITLGSGCEIFLPKDRFRISENIKTGSGVKVGHTIIGRNITISS